MIWVDWTNKCGRSPTVMGNDVNPVVNTSGDEAENSELVGSLITENHLALLKKSAVHYLLLFQQLMSITQLRRMFLMGNWKWQVCLLTKFDATTQSRVLVTQFSKGEPKIDARPPASSFLTISVCRTS